MTAKVFQSGSQQERFGPHDEPPPSVGNLSKLSATFRARSRSISKPRNHLLEPRKASTRREVTAGAEIHFVSIN
jgi:hypothetical protein